MPGWVNTGLNKRYLLDDPGVSDTPPAGNLPDTTGMQNQFGSMFDDYINRMKKTFDTTSNLNYDTNLLPNYQAAQARGNTASQQNAMRSLIGGGYNPNSIAFQRQMGDVNRGSEASIFDAIAKAKMGESDFNLNKANTLNSLLSNTANTAGIMGNYLTGQNELSLNDLWAGQNRKDYLDIMSNLMRLGGV
jgi:hypothetical protein